jgi:hypothetical protein
MILFYQPLTSLQGQGTYFPVSNDPRSFFAFYIRFENLFVHDQTWLILIVLPENTDEEL